MQEIIVYRSPAEAAMWNAVSNADNTFPVMVGIAVFFAVFAILNNLIAEKKPFKKRGFYQKLCLGAGAAVGIIVMWVMWI
jgi:hypothetical protein